MSSKSSAEDVPEQASSETGKNGDVAKLPVDENWLVGVLNKATDSKGVLLGYECSVIGKGKGFVSVCTRVKFNWDPKCEGFENLPSSVVLKIPSMAGMKEIDTNNDWEDITGDESLQHAHNAEVAAYEFLNKFGTPPIPMARVYYTEIMTKRGTGKLILEDFSEIAVQVNLHDDATPEQAMAIAEHVAKLQSFGLEHPDWMDYVKPMRAKIANHMFGDTDVFIKKVYDTFPQLEHHTPPSKLKAMYEKVSETFLLYRDPILVGQPQFLCYGDIQPNNILWHKTEEGRPSNRVAAFLDFQGAVVGYCMSDLANYSYLAMTAATRRSIEEKMLRTYFEIMKKAGAKYGGFELDFQAVRRNFRSVQFINPLVTYPILGPAVAVMGFPDGFKDEMYSRLVSFIEDAPLEE